MKRKLAAGLAIAFAATIGISNSASASIDPLFGYDVSWPQCSVSLPLDGAFKIIGVNNGLPFSENPCLQQQLSWATGDAQLYINTANPGPELSSFWPIGQKSPKSCVASDPDSSGCAFNYGYNFAKDSVARAELAFQNLGFGDPKQNFIWLDVEIENSWRSSTAKNVQVLKGAVNYLRSVGVSKIGFYSNSYQWGEITGGTTVFSDYPAWEATASNALLSIERCAERIGFTGGRLRLAQYIDPELNLDVNVNCLNSPKLQTELENRSRTEVNRSASFSLKARLIAETGNPVKSQKVSFRYRSKTYSVKTNSKGIAKIAVLAPSKKGEYSFRIRFAGSTYFLENSVTATLLVR